MRSSAYSPGPSIVDATYHSMEEINEISRAIGREGEFRQMSKGLVTSQWRWLRLEEFSLTSHRVDKRIHARMSPPKGCVAMAIMAAPCSILVDGREFGSNQVLVADGNSQSDFVSLGENTCYTFILPESVFTPCQQALVPGMSMSEVGTSIRQCSSSEWSVLHTEVASLLRNGNASPEDLSHLLGRFVSLIAREPEGRQEKAYLGNKSSYFVARRAQEYIEDHYSETIRIEDLCRCTGMSMRTIQRSFSEYFQMSPLEYIKARRLGAARQALLASDASRDSVTQIALANGFTHLGRFAVDYRKHFDESPRETFALTNKMGRTG